MFRNSLKIAWRNMIKDRRFSLLNLIGLSTGLACTIAIYLWVNDELNQHHFEGSDNRIYQVMKNSTTPEGITTDERTPGLLAVTLATDFPEITYATAVIPPTWTDKKGFLSVGDRQITADAQFAGRDYFKIFPFEIIDGNKNDILLQKNGIAISDELAKKLFNTTQGIIGKYVEWNQKDYNGQYIITGLFKTPSNVSEQFDLVFNYELFLEKNQKLQNWKNNDPSTYVVVKKDSDARQLNEKLSELIKSKRENATVTLFAQPYKDRYLNNRYENGKPAGGRIEYLQLFSIIAIIILVIACINFMNLTTAKASIRMKQVGVKKVMGARRMHLVIQYLAESLIMSFVSLVFAILLVLVLLPQFNLITGKQLNFPFELSFFAAILTITIITGLISGSYPAFYLSGYKPIAVLKGKLKTSVAEVFIRKGLVIFQFALSAIFIIAVFVVYRQMNFIQTKNLGYNRENLLYFEKGGQPSTNKEDYAPGGKYETELITYLQRLQTIPGVLNAANFRHNITSRDGGTYDLSWPGKNPEERIDFTDLAVGYNFIETAGIQLKEGRTFSPAFGNERSSIIFNELAIETMGLKDPIGKIVKIGGDEKMIIGVVENFNFQELQEIIKPCFFDLTVNDRASRIMVKIKPGNETETIARLESFYKENSNGQPFDFRFLDDDYQALYASEKRVADLSKYFAAMAIVISCLGLFGLAAFTANRRQKEISIRKVTGATVSDLVFLLSKDFLKLVAIAVLISFPIAWWLTNQWLGDFAYRIEPGVGIFILTGFSVILITIITISFESIKAALINPVRALRND